MSENINEFENEAEDLDEMFVTLTFDDGQEEECEVITIFTVGEKDYIALIPVEAADDEEAEIYFYGYKEDAEGNPELTNIEDDDEYEAVIDRFDEICDEMEAADVLD